jgi:hypothetical protein
MIEIATMIVFSIIITIIIIGQILNVDVDTNSKGDLIIFYGRKRRRGIILIKHENL